MPLVTCIEAVETRDSSEWALQQMEKFPIVINQSFIRTCSLYILVLIFASSSVNIGRILRLLGFRLIERNAWYGGAPNVLPHMSVSTDGLVIQACYFWPHTAGLGFTTNSIHFLSVVHCMAFRLLL